MHPMSKQVHILIITLKGEGYRFQRSRWDLEGRERQRRPISTQRDWMWEMSLLMEKESSGDSIPPLEYSRRSRRSTAAVVLSCTFFAFWYISDSAPLPLHPPPAAPSISIHANRERERELWRNR
ncbi:hypothetical protein FH972_017697 [Carpinus fangiana]|uniref:Uncharacterized protein n=1 Tax=Carpinus fangiana TaxID=176857 RepID=A0A5N6RJZ3_9ROSI|nr:hypothetical protein FH972_017697 [Carpinus fangiana]